MIPFEQCSKEKPTFIPEPTKRKERVYALPPIGDRIPPHSVEAEQGALGCVMLSADLIDDCIAALTVEGFYDLRHQIIFQAFCKMRQAEMAMDIITLQSFLKDRNELEGCGGFEYIVKLSDAVACAAMLPEYIDIIREKHYARKVIQHGVELINRAFDHSGTLSELADQTETEIFAMRQSGVITKTTRAESFKRVLDSVQEAVENKDNRPGIATGFEALDWRINRMQPSRLMVVAARPGCGKTALGMQIVEFVAGKGVPVGVFNLEMDEDELNGRSLGSAARVDMQSAMNGDITPEEIQKLVSWRSNVAGMPIHIIDDPDIKIHKLRAEARRMVARSGVKLILIDYLQLVSGSREFRNRVDEVSEVTRELKKMAKELKIPVILLSQLNRDIERRGPGAKPQLSDLRESGSIEQDADIVCFIYAPDETKEENCVLPVRFLIAKGRGVKRGEFDLSFHKKFTRFEKPQTQIEETLL